MENTQRQTVTFQVPTADEIAARRPLIPISFGVAIALFFFTFCDLKCTSGQKIASVTGFELVTGSKLKAPGMDMGFDLDTSKKQEKIPANIWAIFPFVAAIAGLTIFLKGHPKEAVVGAFAGFLGLFSLSVLRFSLQNAAAAMKEMQLVLSFKPAYYLVILAFAVAGTISLFRLRLWESPADRDGGLVPDNTADDLNNSFRE